MREPGPVFCSVLYCKDLSFPSSHIINPSGCILSSQQADWSTSKSRHTSPTSAPRRPLPRVPAVRGETLGNDSSKDTSALNLLVFKLLSGGCEVKVWEVRTRWSSIWRVYQSQCSLDAFRGDLIQLLFSFSEIKVTTSCSDQWLIDWLMSGFSACVALSSYTSDTCVERLYVFSLEADVGGAVETAHLSHTPCVRAGLLFLFKVHTCVREVRQSVPASEVSLRDSTWRVLTDREAEFRMKEAGKKHGMILSSFETYFI